MMEPSNVQFVGSPCGQHGPYTFYKGFKYSRSGKVKILSLGQFFFVKISSDAPICIAELQLLWQDRNNEDLQLASARLYFLPESTPEGRLPHHGQDELLAECEKVVLSIEDLLRWVIEDGIEWPHGRLAVSDTDVTKGKQELYCPPGDSTEAEQLLELFSANNAAIQFNQDVEEVKRNLHEQQPLNTKNGTKENTEVIVLSYSQYCRYRAVLTRLDGCSNLWLKSLLIGAVGGFTVKSADTRIHFCRDTFDHPDLEDHDFRQDHLAPKLKGRPRKRRLQFKTEWSPDSDSNDSSEKSIQLELKKAPRMPLGLQRNNLHALNNCHVNHSLLKPNKVENAVSLVKSEPCEPQKPPVSIKVEQEPSSPTYVKKKRIKQKKELNEQNFLQELHSFMRARNSPIGRIPTLGFKEINLYEFYTYAKKLGGYEQITMKRLWKHIYDRLGGNPSNTSAATCTRRHYERLLLPFERYHRGLESKESNSPEFKKSHFKGSSNTVRNHLKNNKLLANNSVDKASISNMKQEMKDLTKDRDQKLHIPSGQNSTITNHSLKPEPKLPSADTNGVATPAFVMPLNVPSVAAGSQGLLLSSGLTIPPGLVLGLPGLSPGVSANNNQSPSDSKPSTNLSSLQNLSNSQSNSDVRNSPLLPPNVQVLPNGTILSTSVGNNKSKIESSNTSGAGQSRPSVIQHTRKPILNPAPSPRPNIPKTVYGPPNVLPPPSNENSLNHKRSYPFSAPSTIASLQPHFGNSHKTAGKYNRLIIPPSFDYPVKRHRTSGPDQSPGGTFKPIIPASSTPSPSEEEQPTDLSMNTLRKQKPRETLNNVNPKTSSELPLNLSLKAHNMPKTASVCVPKLPVNPFRPLDISVPKIKDRTLVSGNKGDHRTPQHVSKSSLPLPSPSPGYKRPTASSPIVQSRGLVAASTPISSHSLPPSLASTLPIPLELLSQSAMLDGLPLVHPAFPFPLASVLSSASSLSAADSLTTLSMAPSSQTLTMPPLPHGMGNINLGALGGLAGLGGLLPPGLFYPGLPGFGLPGVGTQIYPHLYNPSANSSETPKK